MTPLFQRPKSILTPHERVVLCHNMRKVDHNSEGECYSFKVVVEPNNVEDGRPAYLISCTTLKEYEAATLARTEEEGLKGIQEAEQIVTGELTEDGRSIREGPEDKAYVFSQPRVSVTV